MPGTEVAIPIHVLLIDDDPDDTLLISEALAAASGQFVLACASRLDEGLALLAQGDIDLVLLDLSLPDCVGVDAIVRTRASAAQVPILVLSGFDYDVMMREALRKGAIGYLVKGQIDPGALPAAIRTALRENRLRRKGRLS